MDMKKKKGYLKLKPGEKVKYKTYFPPEEGGAKQEFGKEADINTIVNRALKAGINPLDSRAVGVFADVSKIGDLAEAMRNVQEAEEAFAALPPELRGRFDNDPVRLVNFVSDDRNYDEAVKLGLVPEKVAPVAPPVVAPPAPPVVPAPAAK